MSLASQAWSISSHHSTNKKKRNDYFREHSSFNCLLVSLPFWHSWPPLQRLPFLIPLVPTIFISLHIIPQIYYFLCTPINPLLWKFLKCPCKISDTAQKQFRARGGKILWTGENLRFDKRWRINLELCAHMPTPDKSYIKIFKKKIKFSPKKLGFQFNNHSSLIKKFNTGLNIPQYYMQYT